MDPETGYPLYDAEEPEPTDAEIEEAYIEEAYQDALEQEAATFPDADFTYELACEAKWEREAMVDAPPPRRGMTRTGNELLVRTGRVA